MSVKWSRSKDGELPYHGQYVIIDVNGSYNIAVYNSQTNKFHLNTPPFTAFDATEETLMWTDFKE